MFVVPILDSVRAHVTHVHVEAGVRYLWHRRKLAPSMEETDFVQFPGNIYRLREETGTLVRSNQRRKEKTYMEMDVHVLELQSVNCRYFLQNLNIAQNLTKSLRILEAFSTKSMIIFVAIVE